MPIPKHDDIKVSALQLLNQHPQLKLKEFEQPLALHFNLTEDEIEKKYDSGNGKIFYDRISWALSYLNMAGLVDKPKRGVYAINASGKKLLETPERIVPFISEKMSKRDNKKPAINESNTIATPATPQESLYESFADIQTSVYREILDVILTKTPEEFEKLVVSLLQKMGYGGEVKAAAKVTQRSHDGGIDGIIKEDVLGLGRIYIQAKRYAYNNTVGREEIQKFVGALAVAQSNKGVFITTSSYAKTALNYADSLNGTTNLVLIDGEQLAAYIYEYGLGMQVEQTIEIKKLDSDFWDTMVDESKS